MGCPLFKYRNNKALTFERQQLQRGVKQGEEASASSQTAFFNAKLQSQITCLSEEIDSQAHMETTISQVERILSNKVGSSQFKEENTDTTLANAMNRRLDERDPITLNLLNEVL